MTPIDVLKLALYTRIEQLSRMITEEALVRCIIDSPRISLEIDELQKAIDILEMEEAKCQS